MDFHYAQTLKMVKRETKGYFLLGKYARKIANFNIHPFHLDMWMSM